MSIYALPTRVGQKKCFSSYKYFLSLPFKSEHQYKDINHIIIMKFYSW